MEPTSAPSAACTKAKRKSRLKADLSHAAHFAALPDDGLVEQRVVEALFCVSPATVWRMTRAGSLPAPLKLTGRTVRWRVGALRNALSSLRASA